MYATITSSGPKGYHCVDSSPNMGKSVIQTLVQLALPFGNGWHLYVGARSIKAFPVEDRQMAVSYTRVTSNKDDHGRRGVLMCQCIVVNHERFVRLLRKAGMGFDSVFDRPADVETWLDSVSVDTRELNPSHKIDISTEASLKSLNALKLLLGRRTVLRYPFVDSMQWKSVEQAIQTGILRLPTPMMQRTSFVTLTLSTSEPVQILAMPA